MPYIPVLFFILGLVLSSVGGIWGLVQAFQEDTIWGVLYLLVPFASLVFYIKKWSNKKIRKTFLISLASWPMFILSGITTSAMYAGDFAKLAQSGTITINEGSSEQSPSSFPSDFSTSSSPNQEPSPTSESSPASESSPQLSAAPIPEPTSGNVGVQKSDFKQLMKLGYTYYGQGDYQTALIIFNRALQTHPGNTYAVKAIENTKMAIAQKRVK
jgi:hypothetical protein